MSCSKITFVLILFNDFLIILRDSLRFVLFFSVLHFRAQRLAFNED